VTNGNSHRSASAGAILALLFASSSALAEGPPSPEAARAEALFQEGKKLLEQGSFEAACSRLSRSDALDPTISALGLLAACHEQQGRTATAWREFRAAEKRAQPGDERGEFARQRAAALEPDLPKITIRVARPAPDLEILRNLDPVPLAEIGAEIAVDPGAYEIVARAPKKQEYRATVTAKARATVVVDVPDLGPPGFVYAAAGAAAPPAPVAAAAPPPPRAAPAIAPAAPGNPHLPIALVAGGIGLAGVGVGAAFGAIAMSKNLESTTIHQTCRSPSACAVGADLRSGAYSAATVSTIGFGVGLAGLATATVILLIPRSKGAPRPAAASALRSIQWTPVAGAQGAGAVLSGRF
jgi:hypothetical protein